MDMMLNKIYAGSALEVLKSWSDGFIDCLITSPPYWGLRSYGTNPQIWDGEPECQHIWGETQLHGARGNRGEGVDPKHTAAGIKQPTSSGGNFCSICSAWRGELGLEPTFQLYISHLIQIFDEVKRVLKPTGTCWVNLGDTYNSHAATSKNVGGFEGKQMRDNPAYSAAKVTNKKEGIPDKSLCCIPDRFKIAMVDSGWVCRNEIIWYKRNCMPSSVTDRFTVDFEKIYFFSKQGKYWFEQQFQSATSEGSVHVGKKGDKGSQIKETVNATYFDRTYVTKANRNMRCVWDITTKGYKEAHFATFPEKLIEPMIKSGAPKEVCVKCRKAREKIEERTYPNARFRTEINCGKRNIGQQQERPGRLYSENGGAGKPTPNIEFKGYTDCGCNAGFTPGIVCDIFMGSGTTAVVAKKLGRQYIGVELNPVYIIMAEKRIANTTIQENLF